MVRWYDGRPAVGWFRLVVQTFLFGSLLSIGRAGWPRGARRCYRNADVRRTRTPADGDRPRPCTEPKRGRRCEVSLPLPCFLPPPSYSDPGPCGGSLVAGAVSPHDG